jgi:enoyl-[acyl-carrier-protein] reductase (NADH)
MASSSFSAWCPTVPNGTFRRLTEQDDVASAVAYLCLPESRQITGQVIHVSAGAVV